MRTPAQLIEAYRRGPALLRDALDGMTPEQLRERPIAGKMSSHEVACHIVDSDQMICERIKRTAATDRPLLMGAETVAYLEPLHYHDRDLDLELRLLEVQREQMAADLDRLSPDSWLRTAVHSENGTQTLTEIFEHAVDHLEDHVASIAEKRRVLGAGK